MEILYLIIGLTVGAAAVYFVFSSKIKEQKTIGLKLSELENTNKAIEKDKSDAIQRSKILENELAIVKTQNTEYKEEIESLRLIKENLLEDNSILKTNNKNIQEHIDIQKEELEKLNKRFTVEFENITHKLLEESGKKLQEKGEEQLSTILKPFQEKLHELKTQINNTYDKDTQQRIRLHEQVKQLFELNQQISTDAQNLTNALKSNSKIQGDWGEEILENILQQSGLRKGYEYDTQSSFVNADGKQARPDMIVHYPDNRDIIIDSKVSLTDYERYISAENVVEKENALKAHIQSIKQHIKELSDKNYQDLYQIESLDFVMMFVPIEGAYYIAIEEERTLWQYAYEKKIVLINPTNLITALKMISNIWQQDFQNKNVIEIARQSGGLYDSFVLLLDDFLKMEKKMDETKELFANVQKRISTGKGNLIGRVEKIKKLGAKTKKSLPENFKDAALE